MASKSHLVRVELTFDLGETSKFLNQKKRLDGGAPSPGEKIEVQVPQDHAAELDCTRSPERGWRLGTTVEVPHAMLFDPDCPPRTRTRNRWLRITVPKRECVPWHFFSKLLLSPIDNRT